MQRKSRLVNTTLFLFISHISLSVSAKGQLNTDFTSPVINAVSETQSITLAWNDVKDAEEYMLVEKTHNATEFIEKGIIIDTTATRHSYHFEIPLPSEGITEIWTYKVIGCLSSIHTGQRLCEGVGHYSLPLEIEISREIPFTPIEIQLQYEYDELGRLTDVKDPQNGDRDYQYDAAGNRTSVNVLNNGQ